MWEGGCLIMGVIVGRVGPGLEWFCVSSLSLYEGVSTCAGCVVEDRAIGSFLAQSLQVLWECQWSK